MENLVGRFFIFTILFAVSTAYFSLNAEENLKVLTGKDKNLLYSFLLNQSKENYETRRQNVEKALESPELIAKRQKALLADFKKLIGELPLEKTPLNAEVTGTIQCEGYRIEKVIYESRPNHHVTANLYIPEKGQKPFPGVVIACGHSPKGKATDPYMNAASLFALNGFVTLIFDPVSQGERNQGPIPKGVRFFPTDEHHRLNSGSLLVGRTVVGYEAWDGIRSIDYLLSRDEVDKSKPIGMSGNSGGGTQTNFLMALDSRIGPAAPSCYVTQKHSKFQNRGPADGCQYLPGEAKLGMDHVDYFWMRAPKPTLILAAEKDFNDIKSTRKAAQEAERLFTMLGESKKTGLVSYDGPHAYAKPLREGAVSWMKRWLMNDSTAVIEPKLEILPEKTLQATRTGQVLTAYKNELTVSQMNLKRANELKSQRESFWKDNKEKCLEQIRVLIGSTPQTKSPKVETVETLKKDGYKIEKLKITCKDHLPIPALFFMPDKINSEGTAILFVDDKGKSQDYTKGKSIIANIRNGNPVLSIDVAGFGETANKAIVRNEGIANLSIQLGRPLLGQRVDQLFVATDFLSERIDLQKIQLIGIGSAGPAAIHAAALDKRIESVIIQNSIRSWIDEVVAKPMRRDLLEHVVPGALLKYDLPDLLKAINPRKVVFK